MRPEHPKSVRRRLLKMLYKRYLKDPLDTPGPEELLEDGTVTKQDLVSNIYYLYDRGLVELSTRYTPPMFASARITADGIDLVENRYEFNLRFPPTLGHDEEELGEVPLLIEKLVAEVDISPTDGEVRRALLRDVQYLRDEIARPVDRWRSHVVQAVLGWLEQGVDNPDEALPTLAELKAALRDPLG